MPKSKTTAAGKTPAANKPKAKTASAKAKKALSIAMVEAPLVFKDANGHVYRFKKTTPATLNIDGAPQQIKKLIANKEVMLELIAGNCNFVERIK